ncbi:hypothetical protein FRB90_000287 [Tulasnella sp. 427]|nr:hypothetical protein FRB90_000287 [Tulasnella sp. 427]
MKRSAENQLTKDSREDDDESLEIAMLTGWILLAQILQEGVGFKAASQEALAGRKIKGLPKRRGGGAPTPSAATEGEAPKSLFGGFTGFGTTPAATSNGTSDSAAAKPSPFAAFGGFGGTTSSAGLTAAPTTTSSLFGTAPTAPSKTSQLFGASIAAVSSTVPSSNGTNSAPSFNFKLPTTSATSGNSASSTAPASNPFSFGAPSSSSTTAAPKSTSATTDSSSNDASLDYFLSLRGLNNSLLAAVESAIAKDPFAKLPLDVIAAAYTKHWNDIETKAKTKGATASDVEMKAPAAEPPKAAAPVPAPVPPTFAMPKPPTGGFSFGVGSSTPSFNFGPKPAESAASSEKSSSAPFTFKPPSGGFTFGAQPAPAAPIFGSKSDSTTTSATAPVNLFGGSSLFGPPKPKETESDAMNSDDKDASSTEAPASKPALYPFSALDSKSPTPTPAPTKPSVPSFFSFGATPATTPTQTPGTPDPAEKKPAFAFSFGSGKAGAFNFGAATPGTSTPSSGSLGNPAGFSFGGPKDAIAAGTITPTPGTVAGLEAAKALHDPNAKPEGSTMSVVSEATADAAPPVSDVVDIVGAGEENEDTLLSERGKAYKLKEGAWTDIGTGNFKIKKDRETGTTRVLMRPEHGGNVILNFRFHRDLSPRVGQKPTNLTLVAIDDGKPLNIVMRFANADIAQRVLAKLKEVQEAA